MSRPLRLSYHHNGNFKMVKAQDLNLPTYELKFCRKKRPTYTTASHVKRNLALGMLR